MNIMFGLAFLDFSAPEKSKYRTKIRLNFMDQTCGFRLISRDSDWEDPKVVFVEFLVTEKWRK